MEARRGAYEHDADRYPNYFAASDSHKLFVPTHWKRLGSTAPLHRELLLWTEELPRISGVWQPAALALADPVGGALRKRQGQAITYSYFRSELGDLAEKSSVEYRVRRKISEAFTRDYMSVGSGDIATGIRGLQYFDRLSASFPLYDVSLLGYLAYIFDAVNVLSPQDTSVDSFRSFVVRRKGIQLDSAAAAIRWLISALVQWDRGSYLASAEGNGFGHDDTRQRLRGYLRGAARVTGVMPMRHGLEPGGLGMHVMESVERLARTLGDQHPDLRKMFDESHWGQDMGHVDVLLVTVNDAETNALSDALSSAGFKSRTVFYTNNTYRVYAGVAGTVVATVRSGMSSRGSGGASLTVREAIEDLDPAYVIAVGVAFGMTNKQPIGQVLISRQIADYELQRVGTDDGEATVTDRGARVDAHPRVVGRFLAAELDKHGYNVKFGQIISGDKLIDNAEFRQSLARRFREAIGGEMEGAGIQAAADRAGTQWLVVKAVCDYAAEKGANKARRQAIASGTAARAVVEVIRQGGLKRDF